MPVFNPTGGLNISWDSSDLPDGALTRCKNLRVNQQGQPTTRDGSTKINETALGAAIWWIEEMDGNRYVFAGNSIYENEVSLVSSLTNAQWSAIQYNAFNDTTKQIFALNGTDKKRITDGSVNEWGLSTPTEKPVLGIGAGAGLTGEFNVRYTYVRKIGDSVVAESNPSDPADDSQILTDNSLTVRIGTPPDPQVTHARLYRTTANGLIYYLDTEIALSTAYAYGYAHDWEESGGYIAGTGYNYTLSDDTNGTENTYEWEELFKTHDATTQENDGTPPYFEFDRDRYRRWHRDRRSSIP